MWRLLTGCQEQKLTQGSCPHTHPSVFATQHPLISAKVSKTKFNNSHAILDLIKKKKKSCIFRGIMSPQTKRFVFAYIHHNERTMLKERKRPVLLLLLLFFSSWTTYLFWRKDPLIRHRQVPFMWQQRREEEKQPGWTCSAAPERPEAEVVLSAFLPRSPAGAGAEDQSERAAAHGDSCRKCNGTNKLIKTELRLKKTTK